MVSAPRYCPLCEVVLESANCPTHRVPTVDATFAVTPDRPPSPGMVIGSTYELVEQLGEGGMGIVFQAVHLTMKRQVAVKILRRDLMVDPRILKRFYQEVLAVSSLY